MKETWPESLTVDRHYVPADVQAMPTDDDKENVNYRWFDGTRQKRIQQINDKLADYRQQLTTLKKQCPRLTLTIEEWMDEVIEHEAMQYIRMKYDVVILERQYVAEMPNQAQLVTAHQLYALRFDAEKARRILMEWKQSILEQ